MSNEELEKFALDSCMDIAIFYTKEEVEKFFPHALGAWNAGNELAKRMVAAEKLKRKKVTI